MTKLLPYARYAAKALVAGVVAFTGAAVLASNDGHWTQPEVWTAIGTTVAAIGAVFGFRNGAKPSQ